MKAAVFSDTHGSTELMCGAVRACGPDIIIHLGDHERDCAALRRDFPHIPLYSVCGNCDLYPMSPGTDIVMLGKTKLFITHGHLYNVKYGLDRLVYAAMEVEAKAVLFGHTHSPLNSSLGSMRVINPGTAQCGPRPTWAYLDAFENGGFISEIRPL